MEEIDCKALNEAMEKAKEMTLYSLANKILYGSYTHGIHDRLLLNKLKDKESERDEAQTFKIVEVADKFLVAYWHGGFLGEGFKEKDDALKAMNLCRKAFSYGEQYKAKLLCSFLGG